MNKLNFSEILSYDKNLVDSYLADYFEKNKSFSDLYEIAYYSVKNGGKRFRPILVMEFCEAFGGDKNKIVPIAAAIEMIHTYSLIQDDLPCMDDDELRRGKPSCHIAYGEARALLASDLLLTDSFGMIDESDTDDQIKMEIVKLFSDCAGGRGMIAGQALDLYAENSSPDEALLKKIDSLKTSKLIEASVLAGLIFAKADKKTLLAGSEYAKALGFAFQLTDDLLDVKGDEKLIGKKVGSDDLNEKATYVKIFGLDKTEKKAKEQVQKAVSSIEKFENTEILVQIAKNIINRVN
ncbi:MAG: polyprenyl synthetase family protein [Clostridia bacterium]|nr:polyprenyl synthetase family protein [Clostridia bacterium]